MHYYQHNIKTFNSATQHLTHVERSLYTCLISLYYETEKPLSAVDFDRLARRVMAHSEEEKVSLQFVLDEFFEKTGDVYSHDYCDETIEKYNENVEAKARAGKASALARKEKAEARKSERKQRNRTGVEQVLDFVGTEAQHNPTNTRTQELNNSLKPNKSVSPPSGDRKTPIPPCPYSEIADLWNEILPECPSVRKSEFLKSQARKKKLFTRWKSSPVYQRLEFWQQFFSMIRTKSFWLGDNDRQWQARFDWVLEPGNFQKVLDQADLVRKGVVANA